MSKFASADDALRLVSSNQTVASAGVIGWTVPDALLEALGRRFERETAPNGVTFYFPCGTGDAMGIRGMDHVSRAGLMRRIISGSYINPINPKTGERPALMQLIQRNEVEAYAWPIGASMHWLREVARRGPGYLTRIGVGTFADPDMEGGRITERASEPLIRKITIDGEQYLFYPTFPVDVALICATSADDDGNLSWEDEPLTSANVALALAAKACGGKVIAQVRKRVGKQQRPATAVGLPGVFVDHVVLVEDMLMTSGTAYDPAYTGRRARSLSTLPAMPFTPARIVAHRAAREVRKRELSIFGFGAAADIPRAMVEQKLITDENNSEYWFTTEHGSYGGLVMSGWTFSANLNPEAILDGLPDDATPPLGEALSVAIVATRADLRTARDWIPRRIRPFDSCRVSHRLLSLR